jgi:dolichyl-phosphate beta-glucosyltransferase
MPSRPLSVVIPAYNEELRLQETLEELVRFLRSSRDAFEILVVDDGSEDRTAAIIRKCAERNEPGMIRLLTHEANRGKGFSVRQGALAAEGELLLMTDADLSTPLGELEKLETRLETSSLDIAFGSRAVPGARIEVHQPWYRESLGKGFNRLMRWVTGLPFQDTQCGFKLFRMSTCRSVFERQRVDGFSFDVEVLFIALKWGLRVEEIPVEWHHSGDSKVRPFSHAPSVIVDLLRLHLNNANGLYDRESSSM